MDEAVEGRTSKTVKVTKSVTSRRKPPAKGVSLKGIPNKITAELKDMILKALDEAGGVKYLTATAKTHQAAFLALVGKVLPMQVTGAGGGPLEFAEVRRTVVDPANP
jgi:hypothetical protein